MDGNRQYSQYNEDCLTFFRCRDLQLLLKRSGVIGRHNDYLRDYTTMTSSVKNGKAEKIVEENEEKKSITEDEMKNLITSKEVEFVRLELADTNGCPRGFLQDAHYFLRNYKKGFTAPRAILYETAAGDRVSGINHCLKIFDADAALIPDLDTFCILPWLDKTASLLVDFDTLCLGDDDGEVSLPATSPFPPSLSTSPHPLRHPTSPRLICKRQLEKLSALGYRVYSTFEYEFYLLNKNTKTSLSTNSKLFSTHNSVGYAPLINEMIRNMREIGLQPEHSQCKFGPGQLELTFSPSFGIASPDTAFRYKQLVKEIALQNGYMATFLSKPFRDSPGSSGHFNHSLWDVNGKNGFYDGDNLNDGENQNGGGNSDNSHGDNHTDSDKGDGLSELAKHWLAGLMHHSDALLCFVAPTPNCIERTIAGGLVPNTNAWGTTNSRQVAYRVKNGNSEQVYLENRLPGAGANPYLVTAAYLIAGRFYYYCSPTMADLGPTFSVLPVVSYA